MRNGKREDSQLVGGSARQGGHDLLFRKVSRLLLSRRAVSLSVKTEQTTRACVVVSPNFRPSLPPGAGGRSRLRHPSSFANFFEFPERKTRGVGMIHCGFVFGEDGGGEKGISDDTVLFLVVVPPAYQPHFRHRPITANGVSPASSSVISFNLCGWECLACSTSRGREGRGTNTERRREGALRSLSVGRAANSPGILASLFGATDDGTVATGRLFCPQRTSVHVPSESLELEAGELVDKRYCRRGSRIGSVNTRRSHVCPRRGPGMPGEVTRSWRQRHEP